MPKDKDAKSSKSKDKDKKSSKSKDKDAKSSKSKDKDAKSSKSKDKDAKSSKSTKDKKSSKSGKGTPTKDKGEKAKEGKPPKSGEPPVAETTSQPEPDTLNKSVVSPPTQSLEMGGTYGATSESPFGRFANPHVTQSRICMLHNKALKLFCDTCEELLCYDCTVMGPHNTQLQDRKSTRLNSSHRT